jgi:glucokinase
LTAASTIGLDIGGTKVLGVRLDADGTVQAESRHASPHAGLDALIDTSLHVVRAIATGEERIGVGIAGLVDDAGNVLYSPNLPTVRRAAMRDEMAKATGCAVVVDNDANVALLGEATYGAAAGARHALLVTLGTGIGGGMYLDGALYRGAHNFGAEFGHFTVDGSGPMCACGERGHWEAIASGSALGRIAREFVGRTGGAAIVAEAGGDAAAVSGMHVGRAAAKGDPDGLHVLAVYADNVALGLAALANIFDPETIVIGGGLVELGPLLFGPLHDAFQRHVEGSQYRPSIQIVPAQLGEHAGAIGAAVLARSLS